MVETESFPGLQRTHSAAEEPAELSFEGSWEADAAAERELEREERKRELRQQRYCVQCNDEVMDHGHCVCGVIYAAMQRRGEALPAAAQDWA